MKRSEVRQEETWDLSHIFADRQEWEKEFSRTRMSLKEVNDYRGKLANPEMALRVFRMADELGRSVERIYVYATMLIIRHKTLHHIFMLGIPAIMILQGAIIVGIYNILYMKGLL